MPEEEVISINITLWCPDHGKDVDRFEVGGKTFCALCVAEVLAGERAMAKEVHMQRFKNTRVVEARNRCSACGAAWGGDGGTACPKCGVQADDASGNDSGDV